MRTFDGTMSYEGPELEHQLTQALRLVGDFHTITAIVRESSGQGEVYVDDETYPEVGENDWCVTGNSVWDVARQLRALC